MWKNKEEIPLKNGDYPCVVFPTFQRDGWTPENFRETLLFWDGTWYSKTFTSLGTMQWELVAWFDVPEYNG